jgi:hypothetical protein
VVRTVVVARARAAKDSLIILIVVNVVEMWRDEGEGREGGSRGGR